MSNRLLLASGTSGIQNPRSSRRWSAATAEALDLDGFAIFGVIAVHKPADEFANDRVHIFRNQKSPVFSACKRLELPDEELGLVVHEEQLAATAEQHHAGDLMLWGGRIVFAPIH